MELHNFSANDLVSVLRVYNPTQMKEAECLSFFQQRGVVILVGPGSWSLEMLIQNVDLKEAKSISVEYLLEKKPEVNM